MTTTTILLATGNAKKARELQELCADRFEVKTLKDLGLQDVDVVEDAPDFDGNAQKKARTIAAALQQRSIEGVDIVIADDSGLVVDALDGHPGVRSARFSVDAGFAPPGLSIDDANNQWLLQRMAGIAAPARSARFVCFVMAKVLRTGRELRANGSVEGCIATDLQGAFGFGYDPLFILQEGPQAGQRLAELTSAQKHAVSHRGRALRSLAALL